MIDDVEVGHESRVSGCLILANEETDGEPFLVGRKFRTSSDNLGTDCLMSGSSLEGAQRNGKLNISLPVKVDLEHYVIDLVKT